MVEIKQNILRLYCEAKCSIIGNISPDINTFTKCINSIPADKESRKEFHSLILKDIKYGFLFWIEYYYLRYVIDIDEFKQLFIALGECYQLNNDVEDKLIRYLKDILSKYENIVLKDIMLPLLLDVNNMKLEISDLKAEIKTINSENKQLKDHIDFSPDGSGYNEAKEHFNTLILHNSK